MCIFAIFGIFSASLAAATRPVQDRWSHERRGKHSTLRQHTLSSPGYSLYDHDFDEKNRPKINWLLAALRWPNNGYPFQIPITVGVGDWIEIYEDVFD